MKFKHRYAAIFSTIGFVALNISYANHAPLPKTTSVNVDVDVKHDTSPPLRDMVPVFNTFNTLKQQFIPVLRPQLSFKGERKHDTALQHVPAADHFNFRVTHFQGLGLGLGSYLPHVVPPDANGAVGLSQYVQWVNNDFVVIDKKSGQVLPGYPMPGNVLWKGFGGLCESENDGNPIVKYDQLANRWIFTQVAHPSSGYLHYNFQCVAVSTTSDATGSYYRYAFQFDAFNDSPKLGLWPNAYYLTADMVNSQNYLGPRVCALERKAMLKGRNARMQCAQLDSYFSSLLPADLDGQAVPPQNTPGYLMQLGYEDDLYFWRFYTNWEAPHLSSFSGPLLVGVDPFNVACFDKQSDACIPQPGTLTTLESMSDRLMYRLSYRRKSNYGVLLATHTVKGNEDVDAAIRWYELRLKDGAFVPSVEQQGTYSPDAINRFIGSMAMDKRGNIALGFSLAAKQFYPSIALAVHLNSDPNGVISSEERVVSGSGSQENVPWWGEYSSMAIDPVDDCTFWYTNEYMKQTGNVNWSTYVGVFKLPSCN